MSSSLPIMPQSCGSALTLGVLAGGVLIAVAAIGVQNTQQFKGTETGGLTFGDAALLVGYAIPDACHFPRA